MRLESVSLQNWKGYRRAKLNFPTGDAKRNIVLVEGANGAGKTSLLEAVILGLYGRDGLPMVGRAGPSYDNFLERALNHEAHGVDPRSRVELVFRRNDGELLSFERVWHFSSAGRHLSDDEEVRIREGDEGDLVPVPAPPERAGFLRDYVDQNLLPANLAPFFIFDGENVDRLAGQNLDDQVRSAVEQVLGVPLLRQTAQDLKAFARDRRRLSRDAMDGSFDALRTEVTGLEAEEERLLRAIEATNAQLQPLRRARDDLVRRIGSLHGDSYASFSALFEERETMARARSQDQEELRKALSVDLALALAGPGLRSKVERQLQAEAVLDEWERGRATSQDKFDEFLDVIVQDQAPADPDQMRTQLRSAWERVWLKQPDSAAQDVRHSHLGEAERALVVRLLAKVSAAAGDTIEQIAQRVSLADTAITALEGRIAEQRGLDNQAQGLANELSDLQQRLAELETTHKQQVAEVDEVSVRLSPLRDDLGRRAEAAEAAAPILRRADRAEAYARLLEEWVERSMPERFQELSSAVTEAYRAMAHKDIVQLVRVSSNGAVELLDMHERDVRRHDTSAGETQIFALALMSAIASGTGKFPILMDTPFARLDPEHRANVVRHFADLGVQLILLAHPAELSQEGGELEPRLAGRTKVVHATSEGHGASRVLPMAGFADHA